MAPNPQVSTDDDTLDVLLYYAQEGIRLAEKSLNQKPNSLSAAEISTFENHKKTIEAAPYLIETYKEKLTEHSALKRKMMAVLKKCEAIIEAGGPDSKKEFKEVIKEIDVLTYKPEGEMVIRPKDKR